MNISLYNYMPIEFARSLFERGLYFRLASRFDDKLEGYFPSEKIDAVNGQIDHISNTLHIEPNSQIRSGVKGIINRNVRISQNNTFVNCWHANTEFSPIMWKQYAKNGCYIKTCSWSIFDAIHGVIRNIFEQSENPQNPLLHKVEYGDLNNITDKDASRSIRDRQFHGRKDGKFADENEYRLIISALNFSVCTGKSLNGMPTILGDKGDENIDDYIYIAPCDKLVEELFVRIDRARLIHEIGIVGTEKFDELKSLCKEFGVHESIIRVLPESTLIDQIPY